MIISKDINPKRDLYYLGAKIIEIISAIEDEKLDFFNIFEKIRITEDISIHLYILALDWLFLSGVIDKKENGKIIKCF